MTSRERVAAAAGCLLIASIGSAAAQGRPVPVAEAAVVAADRAFNQAMVDRDLPRFLSLVAEDATFGGGGPNELRGREAIGKVWAAFFQPGGVVLTWKPTRGETFPAGNLGYTVGAWERRTPGAGPPVTTHGSYLTVWRKDADGKWRAIYDTGSEDTPTAK
jgi:ketosteroid isomerase-like protein